MNNDNGNNMNRRDDMVVDGDQGVESSQLCTTPNKDDHQRSIMIQQKVQEQFRDMEHATSELQVLFSKIHSLCLNLDNLRATTVVDTTTTENHNRYCIGDETHHLKHLSYELHRMQRKWESGLRLVKDCIAIRNNDPGGAILKSYHKTTSPMNSAKFLSDLLYRNRTVQDLSLHMNMLLEPSQGDDDDEYRVQAELKGILHCLETSTMLKRVALLCDDPTPQAKALAAICLDALRRNHNIVNLDLELQTVPANALYNLLSTTTLIGTFDIRCFHPLNDTETERLKLAFASNRSVTRLAFHSQQQDPYANNDTNDADWSLIRNVVYTLPKSGCMPLQELSLIDGYVSVEEMQCVSQFLQHTTTLQRLEFRYCKFDAANMERLLEGLQHHYTTPDHRSSLTKLSLHECLYDVEAGRKFLCFMQSTELYPNRTSGDAMLEELNFVFSEFDEDDGFVTEMIFGDLQRGVAMSSIITPVVVPTKHGSTESIQHTVGSQLQALSLEPFYTVIGFCDTTLLNTAVIQLPKLHLSDVGHKEWLQLAKLIPQWKSLRELCLRVDSNVMPNDILAVMRETDHLRALSVTNQSWQPLFNDSEFELAQALCQRNTVLSGMLSRKVHWHWDSHWSERPRHHKRPKTLHCNLETVDDVVILPMLLQAATHVPSTRVSTVLSALLVFEVDCSGM